MLRGAGGTVGHRSQGKHPPSSSLSTLVFSIPAAGAGAAAVLPPPGFQRQGQLQRSTPVPVFGTSHFHFHSGTRTPRVGQPVFHHPGSKGHQSQPFQDSAAADSCRLPGNSLSGMVPKIDAVHMGHFPQDGENEQNVSFFFF